MAERFIITVADVLDLLDELIDDKSDAWWDALFADRSRSIPFFADAPDENLVEWLDADLIGPGRALDLGSGNGRNAIFLATRGFDVDAVDYSAEAIRWAGESALAAGADVRLRCCSLFAAEFADESYELVYDSGCFHHLPPHRRQTYTDLIDRILKPGGHFGLVCFRPEGGSGLTDREVYEQRRLGGGLGYQEEQLRSLWNRPPFSVKVLRQMREIPVRGGCFGEDFLWTLLSVKEMNRLSGKGEVSVAREQGGQVSPIPEHLHTITPRLVVRDGAAAIDFYRDAFGAVELGGRFTGPDGELIHAELRIGDAVVMITDEGDDGSPARSPESLGGVVSAIMATYWEDVDAAWARALAAGAEVVYPLDDQFYGERAGRLRDPAGQQWMLSQRIELVSPEEMQRRAHG